MAHKADKMHPQTEKSVRNVHCAAFSKRSKVTKIHFRAYRACVLKISNKACRTGYPYPDPAPEEKHVLDIRIRLKTYYPAGFPSGKPDSDHLCCTVHSNHQCCHSVLLKTKSGLFFNRLVDFFTI